MKFDDILIALPALNKKQLGALRVTIDHLIGNEPDPNDPTAELFNALTIVLGMQRMSFANFSKTATFKVWRKLAPDCIAFINETWPEATQKVTRQALMVFLLGIQHDTMKGWGVPITLNAMVNALQSFKATFDHAFPGYIEGGMAHLILQRMQKGLRDDKEKSKGRKKLAGA